MQELIGGVQIVVEEVRRAMEQLVGRIDGPMRMRLLLQPLTAILMAIRSARRDLRANKPAFLREVIRNRSARREMLHSAWKDLCRLMLFCYLMDSIYQMVVLRHYYPIQALIVVFVMTIIPYVFIRGPITRVIRAFASKNRKQVSGLK